MVTGRVFELTKNTLIKIIDNLDYCIAEWMYKYGRFFLRISLAVIFIWFGLLKPFHMSPAEDLVKRTVYWMPPEVFLPILGWWEVAIGICLIFRKLLRLGLLLLILQMIGTFLPLIILPNVVWLNFPFILSLEGQYIIKNLILISAGIVVGGTLHIKKRKGLLL